MRFALDALRRNNLSGPRSLPIDTLRNPVRLLATAGDARPRAGIPPIQRSKRGRRAGVRRAALEVTTFGAVTVRLPSELPQPTQRNSCNSPVGSTSSIRSRTSCDLRHFGQYNSLAVKLPN
jgi:hypothetical protein